jgi:hypothetical protein
VVACSSSNLKFPRFLPELHTHTHTHTHKDVVVDDITLAYADKELLAPCLLRIVHGHRYCLLGRNGAGKSTLLRRMASGMLPGFPPHLRILYVRQELDCPVDGEMSAVDFLVARTGEVTVIALEKEQRELEAAVDELEIIGGGEGGGEGRSDGGGGGERGGGGGEGKGGDGCGADEAGGVDAAAADQMMAMSERLGEIDDELRGLQVRKRRGEGRGERRDRGEREERGGGGGA